MQAMKTGCRGTFLISWAQSCVDGQVAPPLEALRPGVRWCWTGAALCLDRPSGALALGDTLDAGVRRLGAARAARRIFGAPPRPEDEAPWAGGPADRSFSVTDGRGIWNVQILGHSGAGALRRVLLLFRDAVPPRDTWLWVVEHALPEVAEAQAEGPAAVCFTPGTLIDTPQGPRPVEALCPGDLVLTRDDGSQQVIWTGGRWFSGARLRAFPDLHPVRFAPGALGRDRQEGLLVSPHHRMLLSGRAAQALFNEPEVLVRAIDLVNGSSVRIDRRATGVQYIHLMFARHQIVTANGLESESFHPAATVPEALDGADHARLLALMPALARDPRHYGDPARRALNAPEAAILRHGLAA